MTLQVEPRDGCIWIMEDSAEWKSRVIVATVHQPADMKGATAEMEMRRRAQIFCDVVNGEEEEWQ